jgi:ATP/maltotriose-dependent transcriptional regulator MalT
VSVRIVVLVQLGRFDEAFDLATVGRQIADAASSDDGLGLFSALLASIELQRGKPREAIRWATDGARRLARIELVGGRRSAIVTLAHAQAIVGDLESAEHALWMLEGDERRQSFTDEDEARARAWVDVAAGRATAALARLEVAAERVQQSGRLLREMMLLHDLVRLGHAHVVVGRLREVVPASDSQLARVILDHAEGVAGGDAARLEAAAEGYLACGATLWSAEAWAQLAVLHTERGRRGSASAAAARSSELLAACEGAVTPALSLGGAASNLSAREREIAGLAARGMSDKEIAAQLVVSVRTVQSHLYNAYAKLGVDGRAELANVLL